MRNFPDEMKQEKMPKLKPESQNVLVESQPVWQPSELFDAAFIFFDISGHIRCVHCSPPIYRGFTSRVFLYKRKLQARCSCGNKCSGMAFCDPVLGCFSDGGRGLVGLSGEHRKQPGAAQTNNNCVWTGSFLQLNLVSNPKWWTWTNEQTNKNWAKEQIQSNYFIVWSLAPIYVSSWMSHNDEWPEFCY